MNSGDDFCFNDDYGPDLMRENGHEIAALYYSLTGDTIYPEDCSYRCAC